MKPFFFILSFSGTVTAKAQIAVRGLVVDLDVDKGVEVEDRI